MPLYRIEEGKVRNVPTKEFASEAELQKLIDENLEDITGIRVVETQYSIPNGRLDTLGIDEQGVPVVIEYKWGYDPGAIIQGLFYLQWVKENRRTFELLAREKFGKIKINWGSPARLLIVAKQFDIRELSAINLVAASVELLKYSFYGDMLAMDDVTPPKTVKKPPKGRDEEIPISIEEEKTVEDILKKASPDLRKLFLELRENVRGLGEEVREKVGGWYCDYRKSSTFVTITPQSKKNRLLIFIKMGDKILSDPQNWATPILPSWGYGKLNTKFEMDSTDQLPYAMQLIKQAYEYVP